MSTQVVQQWLASQCTLIRGVHSGLVLSAAQPGHQGFLVRWPPTGDVAELAITVAEDAVRLGKPQLRIHHPDPSGTPRFVFIAAPLPSDGATQGAVALCLEPPDSEQGKRALILLRKGIPWLRELLQSGAAQAPASPTLELITHLLAVALEPQRFNAAATAVATELAARLGCDRVALGLREHRRTRLMALSHNAEVRSRQDLALALTAAMDEAIDQAATLQYPPPAAQRLPRIILAQRDLHQQFHTGALCAVPLFAGKEDVGALLFERPLDRPFDPATVEMCEHLACFLAPVLKLRWQADQPRWRRWQAGLLRLGHRFRQRDERRLRGLTLVAVFGVTFLTLLPVPFQISAPARLEGAIQRTLTAPNDGFIKQLFVRPGDHVTAGAVIVELEDTDLLLEKRRLTNELSQFEGSYGAALASKDRTQFAVTVARMEETKARLNLIEQQLARVQIRAPFDGVLIQGDLTQSLGAPVKQGDALVVVAPSDDYRVILEIAETDIAHLRSDARGTLALAAEPSRRYPVRVKRVTPLATIREARNVFEAEAALEIEDAGGLRPGLKGVAKLEVGRRPLAWLALHDVWRWWRFKWWSWTGRA